jgi:hypothetical protein
MLVEPINRLKCFDYCAYQVPLVSRYSFYPLLYSLINMMSVKRAYITISNIDCEQFVS